MLEIVIVYMFLANVFFVPFVFENGILLDPKHTQYSPTLEKPISGPLEGDPPHEDRLSQEMSPETIDGLSGSMTDALPEKTIAGTEPISYEIRAESVSLPPEEPVSKPDVSYRSSFVESMNSYRKENGLSLLEPHPLLCSISSRRLDELSQNGALDGHSGFAPHVDSIRNIFSAWGEIIHTASDNWSEGDVIRKGWKNSQPHNGHMLNSSYTHGCGSKNEHFAVFIFGKL